MIFLAVRSLLSWPVSSALRCSRSVIHSHFGPSHLGSGKNQAWFHACDKHVCCFATVVSMWMVLASLVYLMVLWAPLLADWSGSGAKLARRLVDGAGDTSFV